MNEASPAIGTVSAAVVSVESEAMGAALQRYLDGRHAGVKVERCAKVSGGYETYIYEVRCSRSGDGPAQLPVDQRLILRIYHGFGVVERSGWERAVIERVRRDGILAPEVFLYEPDGEALGGPFLVLQFMPGQRLDEAALHAGPVAVVKMLRAFSKAQAALYKVDWPEEQLRQRSLEADMGPFAWTVDRLGAARREILARNLRPLLPVVDWLEENRALIADEPEVLIHGDFHPLNVFIDGTAVSGIIDWGAGGFANQHEDMGWTSLLIATATGADKEADKKLAPFRTVARRLYLAFLWKSAGVDRDKLRYGEVYAGLRWMLVFLPSYLPNAGEPFLNADAGAFTTPQYVRRVRRFLEQRTKLTLGIL